MRAEHSPSNARAAAGGATAIRTARSSASERTGRTATLVVLAGTALYVATMAPTVLWGDDAELQRIVVTGEPRVIGQSSSASHLLWLAVARAFVPATGWLPLDPAGRSTLLTAIFAGLALGATFLAGREIARAAGARPVDAGLGAAGALAVSHTFWLLADRPDVYTLQVALMGLALWSVLRWRSCLERRAQIGYVALGVATILAALANHAMILASLPGLLALCLAVQAPRRRAALIWLVGVAGTAGLVLLAAVGAPTAALLRTLAAFRPVVPSVRDLVQVPAFLLYQFPTAIVLAFPGVQALQRRDPGLLVALALLYAGNVALPLSIRVADRFLFFLPSYVPVALLIGAGSAMLRRTRSRLPRWLIVATLAAPLLLYPIATLAGGVVAARLAPARRLPGRDPIAFYLWPPKTGYGGARAYAENALTTAAKQAAILADWLPYQTLRYLQRVEGRRPDLLLENRNANAGGAQLRFLLEQEGRRPLYLADNSPPPYYDMAEIGRCFSIAREGVLYRLTPRPAAPTGCA